MIFSCIIPAKDENDPKLADLIRSIRAQKFPPGEVEIIVVTEGDSESAKAIGIKKAEGDFCVMLCTDNYIVDKHLFGAVRAIFDAQPVVSGVYSKFYHYDKTDNSLNRYFSLMGNNDPIPFYLNKCDRKPWYDNDPDEYTTSFGFRYNIPSLGDNGFFYRTAHLKKTNLDNYYPMDNAVDMISQNHRYFVRYNCAMVWHRTSDNLISFLKKRYIYARDLYCERSNRRWKVIDTAKDKARLLWFIVSTVTALPCLWVSLKGYSKIRDRAWFWHWPVCIGFLITYGILTLRNLCLVLSSLQRLADLKRLGTVLSPCGLKPAKTLKSSK